jgi:hypothetical protein
MKTRWPLWHQEVETKKKNKKVKSGEGKCYNFSLKFMTKVKALEGEQAKMGKYLGFLNTFPQVWGNESQHSPNDF